MKIRYFDFGLHRAQELFHMQKFLPSISNDIEYYGFEACKTHADFCNKYKNKNTKILQLAISNTHNDVIKLYHSSNLVGHSIHSTKSNVDKTNFEYVNTIKFSKWLKENNIDLKDSFNIIKINIEGAEWEFFNDIVNSDLNKYVDIFCGQGHDVEKIKNFVDDGIVEKYYKLLKDNDINILRWCVTWKIEKNVDLPEIIKKKYSIKNISE